MGFDKVWRCIAVAVCSLALTITAEDCQFPDYLLNDPGNSEDFWKYQFNADQRGKKLTFVGGNLTEEATLLDSLGEKQYGNCAVAEGEGEAQYFKIVIGNDTKCYQFQKKTENVIRISTTAPLPPNDTSCEDEMSNTEILVANLPRDGGQWKYCPEELHGGFMLSVNGTDYPCEDYTVPSQMHVECVNGDGMQMVFPSTACIPMNGWQTDQKLYCGESWTEDQENVVLLGEAFGSPAWCLSYAEEEEGVIKAVLTEGIQCPSPSEENAIGFNLNLTRLKNVCGNDLEACEETYCAEEMYAQVCRDTCGNCSAEAEDPQGCTFDFKQDTWYQVEGPDDFVTIGFDGSQMTVSESTKFACSDDLTDYTYVVKSLASKGCRAQYSCVKFRPASDAVLRYKMGQGTTTMTDKYELCSENNFRDGPPPLGDRFRSGSMKNLVASDLENKTIRCGFHGNFSMAAVAQEVHQGSTLEYSCNGTMSSLDGCNETDVATVNLTCNVENKGDRDPSIPSTDYGCLASFPLSQDGSFAVIMSPANANKSRCWVLSEEGVVDEMYLLGSGQCNEGTMGSLLSHSPSPHIKATNTRDDVCDEVVTTPATTQVTDNSTLSNDTGTTTSIVITNESQGTSVSMTSVKVTTSQKTQSTTEQDKPVPGSSSLSSGTIAGIVFGIILALFLISVMSYYGWKVIQKRRTPYRYAAWAGSEQDGDDVPLDD